MNKKFFSFCYNYSMLKDIITSDQWKQGKSQEIFFFNVATDSIRKRYGADQEVHVIYEDKPDNDFKSLFSHTEGKQCFISSKTPPEIKKNLNQPPCLNLKKYIPEQLTHLVMQFSAIIDTVHILPVFHVDAS